jgi:hypothetical protein
MCKFLVFSCFGQKDTSVTTELLVRKSLVINPSMCAVAFGDSYINGAGATFPTYNSMFPIIGNVLKFKATSNWSKSGSGMLLSAARSFIFSRVTDNDTAQFLWSGYNDLRRTGASVKGIGQLTNGLRSFITNQFLTTAVAASDAGITYGTGWTEDWISNNYGGKASTMSVGFGAQTNTASTTATWTFTGNNVVVGTFGSDGTTVLDSFYVYIDNILMGGYNFNNTYGGVADLSPAPIDNKIGPACVVLQNLSNASHTLKITKGMGAGKLIIDYLGTMRNPAKCYPVIVAEIPYFTQFEYDYSLSNWGVVVNDSIVNDFNLRIRNVVREFNGYPVTTSPTNNYMVRATDYIYDSTHPNDQGHMHAALSLLSVVNPNTSTLQTVTREGKTTTDSVRFGSSTPPTKQLDVTGSVQLSDSILIGDINNTTTVPSYNLSRNTTTNAITITHRIATGYVTQPGFTEVTYPSYTTGPMPGYAWSFEVGGSNPILTLRNGVARGVWIGADLNTNAVLKLTANSQGFLAPSNLFSIKDSTATNFLLNCAVRFNKMRFSLGDSLIDSIQFYVKDTAVITKLIVGPKPPLTSLFPLYSFTNSSGLYMHYSDGSSNPTIQFSKFSGTYASPTGVLKSTNLFAIAATPFNGTAFSGTMISITAGAAENQTTTARGGYIDFQTTPKGTTTRNTNVTITDGGNVLIGQRNGTTVWAGGTPYDSSVSRLDIVNQNDTATLSPSISVRGNVLPNRMKRTTFSVLPNGNTYAGGTFTLLSAPVYSSGGISATGINISTGRFETYTPTVNNIYNTSSFLTGNRSIGGRNNQFGLTIDSLSYLFQTTRSGTSDTASQISIVPGQVEMKSYRTSDSRVSVVKTSVIPGNYKISVYNGNSSTGLTIDSFNNTGLGTISPTEKLQVIGNVKLIHLIGGSIGPTAVIGSAVAAGSVVVTGTDIAGTVTLTVTTGGSFATLAHFFGLTFNSTYLIAPKVIFSPYDAGAANLSAVFAKNVTTSSFQLASGASGTLNTGTYTWTYHAIQ